MIDFKSTYSRDEILDFLKNSFIKDFQKDVRIVDVPEQKYIQEAHSLGYAPELELSVFEFLHEGGTEKRVTLTKEAFNVLRDSGSFKAIGIFHSKDTDDWRFSLMTATPTRNEKNKVQIILSNPKRYSFLLGPNAKVNTPTKFLITKGEIQNFEDLKERFSIEVVNKEFYKEISKLFIQLVGGTLGKGRSEEEYKALLRLPGVKDSSQTAQEFAVRLIGRLIFCWFLREKRNGSEESLMPHSLLSLEASKNNKNYYHGVLEPIFFKVLNVPLSSRKDEEFSTNPYDKIPYLNGGLFSPHDDDFYSTNESKQENNNEEVVVPDKWLQELFEILETYNFTIDENSAFDEELSIDPEMLGRIFENLLAEINPETGESARKSTGSYYTPRVIVDYMVDESLYLYLYNKTEIEEEKLRSLISYDLDDDSFTPLTEDEKEKIITAIDELKILDPACGSGAFPMGALQKIVFILQQLDPNGQFWFKAQLKEVSPELKKTLERENREKNFDYIRKQGVIRKNIFGVDIQPIATEISRLRCFLTLIVDQKVDDSKENRGIDPLPNLDFKFVTANSLLSLSENDGSPETLEMFEDNKSIDKLKEIRDQFFNASIHERNELKLAFKDIQLEMSRHYNSVKNAGASLTEQLLSWNPFVHKMTAWFDPDWMFGIKEGFDIVIGNPPYIRVDDIEKGQKEYIKKHYKFAKGKYDMYYLFFELSIRCKSRNGIISLITPNKWTAADSAIRMRQTFIKDSLINEILSTSKLDVFTDASNYPVITFLKDNNRRIFVWEASSIDELSYKKSKKQYTLNYEEIFFPGNVLPINTSMEEINLLRKIYRKSQYLGEIIEFSEGLRIPKKYEDSSGNHEILKQYQFERYSTIKKGTCISTENMQKVVNFNSDRLLKAFRDKIVIAEDALYITATRDDKKMIPQGGVYYGFSKDCDINNAIVLSLLNSLLYDFVYRTLFGGMHMGGGYLRFRSKFLEVLPVPISLKDDRQICDKLEALVNDLWKADDKEGNIREINQIIFDLFNLTNEEVKLIN